MCSTRSPLGSRSWPTLPMSSGTVTPAPTISSAPTRPDAFVLIDFGFWKPLPLGFDLGQLLLGDVQIGRRPADDLAAVDAGIVPAYVEGLTDEGYEAEPAQVERLHALQMAVFSGLSSMPFEHLGDPPSPALERLAATRAAITTYCLDRVEATHTGDALAGNANVAAKELGRSLVGAAAGCVRRFVSDREDGDGRLIIALVLGNGLTSVRYCPPMGTATRAGLREALDALAAVDLEALSDGELHAVVVELGELSTRLEAQWCRAIARWDARMVWADNGSRSAGARLSRETGRRPGAVAAWCPGPQAGHDARHGSLRAR